MLTRKLFPRWFQQTVNTHRYHDRLRRKTNGNMSYDDLWLMYLMQGGRCAQTGIPMYLGESNQYNAFRCSVDRLDNTLPHNWDNIQLVIRAYNTSKAGRDDYAIPESVIVNMRRDYRARPLDLYLVTP